MVKGSCPDLVAKVSAKVSAIPQSLAAQTASKDMQNISEFLMISWRRIRERIMSSTTCQRVKVTLHKRGMVNLHK